MSSFVTALAPTATLGVSTSAASTAANHLPATSEHAIEAKAALLAQQLHLDPSKPEAVLAVGAQAQQQATAVSATMLQHVQVKDAGDAGKLLGDLALKCKSVDVAKLQPGWRDKLVRVLPFVGGVMATLESYKGLVAELDGIGQQLDRSRGTILADVASLNSLFDQNAGIYEDLKTWQKVLEIKREELDVEISSFAVINGQAGAPGSVSNPQEALRQSDIRALRDRVDRQASNLELAAAVRLQMAPRIRIVQVGNIALADKLQGAVLTTLPLWKDNLSLYITQQRQRQASELMAKVDDTTNDLLRSSAEMLHTNTVAIARQSTRGVVDVQTLEFTQQKLLATVAETEEVLAGAASKRAEAHQAIERMAGELAAKQQQQQRLGAGR